MTTKWMIPLALVGLLAGVAISVLVSGKHTSSQAVTYETTLTFSPARELVQLPDAFSALLPQQADHWQLIFMGYTSCPDICPTTLMELNLAYPKFQQQAATRIMMLTADPLRDTPEYLATYVRYFNPEFSSLSLPHNQLFGLSQQLMLPYSIVAEMPDNPNYPVSHSAAIAVINPRGQLAAMFKPQRIEGQLPTLNMELVVKDFATLVAQHTG